jgi:hypothetical protein
MIMGGDGVLERILFPIVKYSMTIKREKPSEVGTTENQFQYSIPGAPCENSGIIGLVYLSQMTSGIFSCNYHTRYSQ